MKSSLHIGVFREGKIVDERYAPEKGTVSIGRSADNTFALLGTNLPDKYTLVTFERHLPLLHLTAGMTGEIALDGKSRKSLDELRSKGRTQADGWVLELPEATRGWVRLGDTTFFLQPVHKPPPPPPSTLPRVARGGIFSQIERTFGTIFVIALVVESAAIIAINRQPDMDPDAPLSAPDIDRFAEMVKQPEPPKPVDKPDVAKDKKDEPKKKSDDSSEAKEKKHAADVKKAVDSSALLQVLGTTAGNGALANVFASGRGFSADISDALNGGVRIASDGDAAMHKGASGDGGPVGIGDLGTAAGGGNRGKLGEKKHIAPQISVDDTDVDVESTSVDKDALSRFIKLRLRSIEGCYERELKLNPALKGKIVVRFVVTSTGRVGECSIDSDSMHDEEVSGCIVRLIKNWNFPFKPDEDAPVIFPFVFQPGG